VRGLARWVRLRWIGEIWVLVKRARRLKIQWLLLGLMEDFLRRICGCRVLRSRGMAFLCEYRGQVRATGCRIELLLMLSGLRWVVV
jgi:hypothetical protein